VLLLLYSTISLKSEYLLMAFLPRTEQRPAFSRLIDKARLTSEVLYPKSLTAKWQIMPLASLTCLFRLAEISDASFRSRWHATAFINCSNMGDAGNFVNLRLGDVRAERAQEMALFRRTKLFIFLTNSLIVLHQFFQNDQYCLLPEYNYWL